MMMLDQELCCCKFREPHGCIERINAGCVVGDKAGQILFIIACGCAGPLEARAAIVPEHPLGGVGVECSCSSIGSKECPGETVDAGVGYFSW